MDKLYKIKPFEWASKTPKDGTVIYYTHRPSVGSAYVTVSLDGKCEWLWIHSESSDNYGFEESLSAAKKACEDGLVGCFLNELIEC